MINKQKQANKPFYSYYAGQPALAGTPKNSPGF